MSALTANSDTLVCPAAITELAKHAARNDKIFVLNLSAPFIPSACKDLLHANAPYWDYIIGNESEAAAYAESHGLAATEARDVCLYLANLPKENTKRKRVAIITQGTGPTVVAIQGDKEVKEFPVHVVARELIQDTNGAGDAFAGGFLAGILQAEALETAVDMGQWLAKLSIQQRGLSCVCLLLDLR